MSGLKGEKAGKLYDKATHSSTNMFFLMKSGQFNLKQKIMYSDEYYLNQLSYFLVFIPIFARKYTIMITEELQKLYLAYTGVPAENITELPSSGSNRRYFRLAGCKH